MVWKPVPDELTELIFCSVLNLSVWVTNVYQTDFHVQTSAAVTSKKTKEKMPAMKYLTKMKMKLK